MECGIVLLVFSAESYWISVNAWNKFYRFLIFELYKILSGFWHKSVLLLCGKWNAEPISVDHSTNLVITIIGSTSLLNDGHYY